MYNANANTFSNGRASYNYAPAAYDMSTQQYDFVDSYNQRYIADNKYTGEYCTASPEVCATSQAVLEIGNNLDYLRQNLLEKQGGGVR